MLVVVVAVVVPVIVRVVPIVAKVVPVIVEPSTQGVVAKRNRMVPGREEFSLTISREILREFQNPL